MNERLYCLHCNRAIIPSNPPDDSGRYVHAHTWRAECGRAEPNQPGDEVVWSVTVADLNEIAERELSELDLQMFAASVDHSSIPEAIATILDNITTTEDAQGGSHDRS